MLAKHNQRLKQVFQMCKYVWWRKGGGGVTILMVDGSHCKFWPIDLITVCNSIWSARQTCLELQCLYGNSMSNDFS